MIGGTRLAAALALSSALVLILICSTKAAHLSGTFRTQDFFKFIVKFGFQQTEKHSQRDSFGYIYGNITSRDAFPVPLTLAVLDKDRFLDFYQNRTVFDKDMACKLMFRSIEPFAYDPVCKPRATGDFLRKVPCVEGHLCPDETAQSDVVAGHQLTYVLANLKQPSFWYVSLVACYQNPVDCTWHHFDPKTYQSSHLNNTTSSRYTRNPTYAIDYDLHLVNGNPNHSSSSPMSFQFSFDQQNILEMNLIFFMVYLVLVPLQLYAVRIQKHPVTKLFTLSLVLEMISLALILWHLIRFAAGGVGNNTIKTTGDILDIFSRTSFMLILLLLAKGWAVTRQQVSRTGWLILMTIWIPYCAFHVVLYIWNRTEVDIISDIDEYQTWPGLLVLACRSSFMLWFLYELRNTMKYEHSTKKLDFLLHFGASSLVWFIYLPVVAIVALQVSPMWRCKLLLGITNSADCLAYCVMTGLLWPNRSGQYLLLAGTNYNGMDELDEFNEATHIVHGDVLTNRGDPRDDVSNHAQRQRMSADVLEDDDEDIVLSTDDLLRGSGHPNLTMAPQANGNHHSQRLPNGDLGGPTINEGTYGQKAADWHVNT